MYPGVPTVWKYSSRGYIARRDKKIMFGNITQQIELFTENIVNYVKSNHDLIHIYVEQTEKSSPFIYTKMGDKITDDIIDIISDNCKVDKMPYQDGFRNFTNSLNFLQAMEIVKASNFPFKIEIVPIGASLK